MTTSHRCRNQSPRMAALLILSGTALFAADIHVAPDGKADADGTQAKPYDLGTAFAGQRVQPGDTVILKGGRYDGSTAPNEKGIPKRLPFEPKLKGTADKPILVTSARGEWAHLNGYLLLKGCNDVRFERLEIGDLDWDPTQTKFEHGPGAVWALDCVGVKVVNCNLFGATQGTGLWRPALGFELYGNLIHDHGVESVNVKPGGRG